MGRVGTGVEYDQNAVYKSIKEFIKKLLKIFGHLNNFYVQKQI